jgi:DNA-binding HxlR family transcriptional regulator
MALELERKLVFTADNVYCPVRATLAVLGQKWVPHIIYELMVTKRRFNELAAVVGGCNSRTLRDRLKGLEELGIVSRRIVETMPPWVEYELTFKGRELAQSLAPLEEWGRKYMGLESV